MREVKCLDKLQGQHQLQPLVSPTHLESSLVLGNPNW